MSDYVHEKVIAYPITKEQYDKLDNLLMTSGKFEAVSSFHRDDNIGFSAEGWDDGDELCHYLCYRLYYKYGEGSDSFGISRVLNPFEVDYWFPKFAELMKEIGADGMWKQRLKYVDFCYYNGVDTPDYYNHPDGCADTTKIDPLADIWTRIPTTKLYKLINRYCEVGDDSKYVFVKYNVATAFFENIDDKFEMPFNKYTRLAANGIVIPISCFRKYCDTDELVEMLRNGLDNETHTD